MRVDSRAYTQAFNELLSALLKSIQYLTETERKDAMQAMGRLSELVLLSADLEAIKKAESLSREKVIDLHLDQCTKLILLLRSRGVSQKEIVRQLNSDIWLLSDAFESIGNQGLKIKKWSFNNQKERDLLSLKIEATISPPIEAWKLESIIANEKLSNPKLKRFVIKWLAARRWVEKRLKEQLQQWETN
jgi:hypothetical protein